MAQAKKRQKFFDIEIPLIAKKVQLYGYELSNFNNRTIIYDLTRMLRGKGMVLKTQVKVEEDKATTVPKELKVMPFFIRRMMRKGTNYVEDSFSAPCKDATLRLKPFLITRKKVSRRIRKALRDKAREEVTTYIKTKSTNTLFDEVMKNKLQKDLGQKLKKVYPLSLCEIRTITVEGDMPTAQKERVASNSVVGSKEKPISRAGSGEEGGAPSPKSAEPAEKEKEKTEKKKE